jgi:predicted RecA/RadA family phage recombinase
MVYMAVGRPTKVKPEEPPEGGTGELWVYSVFYLPPNATHYRPAMQKTNTPYEEARPTNATAAQSQQVAGNARAASTATATGSLEPADLQSYTLNVSFHNGKVVKYWITKN